MATAVLVTLADIRAAADILAGVAFHTPLVPAPALGENVWLKAEMFQRGGSFKFRGAYTFIAKLTQDQRARGVITPSSGNNAQAVASAARLFGIPATVVMPETVTATKRRAVERVGARIILCGTTTRHRMERAVEIAGAEGLSLVPPYDDPTIISAQATLGLEIVSELPTVRTVFVPVGGGGLSAGVAAAVKLVAPEARVIGVEPTGAPKLTLARRLGTPVELARTTSIADGLLAVRVGDLNFAHHQAFVDDVVTVEDSAIRAAVRALIDRAKVVAEPSGAISLAGYVELARRHDIVGPTVLVLSGGSVEWGELREIVGE
jgi:threonine dehydratase